MEQSPAVKTEKQCIHMVHLKHTGQKEKMMGIYNMKTLMSSKIESTSKVVKITRDAWPLKKLLV